METKEKMLEVIYEKVADKTLSFGTKTFSERQNKDFIFLNNSTNDDMGYFLYKDKNENFQISWAFFKDMKIIWKPIMFWDMIDFIENIFCLFVVRIKTDNIHILKLWKAKRKPIEEQSIECIEYCYNLIINHEPNWI